MFKILKSLKTVLWLGLELKFKKVFKLLFLRKELLKNKIVLEKPQIYIICFVLTSRGLLIIQQATE